jgi:hypothetical protein
MRRIDFLPISQKWLKRGVISELSLHQSTDFLDISETNASFWLL